MLGADKTRPWALAVCCLLASLLVSDAKNDFRGLNGRYCSSRYQERQCCPGRQDDCSVPIIGTLCYCDEFCDDRDGGDEDCCPDYRSFCKGDRDASPENISLGTCTYKGKTYDHGKKIKENCNVCKCSSIDNIEEVLCENKNCLMDQDLIDRVNIRQNSGWIARNYSEFWGRTFDEALQLKLGTKNPARVACRLNPLRKMYEPDDLPKEFDSRIKWQNYISPIHDQGWCASSWAISTVDVISDRFAIMSQGKEKVQLSAQHLISCNSRGQLACDGGYIDRAWIFMHKFGATDEECYPWLGKGDKCRMRLRGKLSENGCKQRNSYSLRDEYYKIGTAYRLNNETDIMYEIAASGPVQATMRVYQDFFHYESGIYSRSQVGKRVEPSDYHSVRIVGWGEEPSPFDGRPLKFWRVANSWGRDWGEDGYFRILRGTNECEIESFVISAWAKTV